jgi:hypothetical protein
MRGAGRCEQNQLQGFCRGPARGTRQAAAAACPTGSSGRRAGGASDGGHNPAPALTHALALFFDHVPIPIDIVAALVINGCVVIFLVDIVYRVVLLLLVHFVVVVFLVTRPPALARGVAAPRRAGPDRRRQGQQDGRRSPVLLVLVLQVWRPTPRRCHVRVQGTTIFPARHS